MKEFDLQHLPIVTFNNKLWFACEISTLGVGTKKLTIVVGYHFASHVRYVEGDFVLVYPK